MIRDTPPQPHMTEWRDPTGNAATTSVDRQRDVDRERRRAIVEFAALHPGSSSRAISRALGHVSRLQVTAALEGQADG